MIYTSVWAKVEKDAKKRAASKIARQATETIRKYELNMLGIREKLGYYDAQIKKIVRKNFAILKANRKENGKFLRYELLVLLCLNSNTKVFPQLEDYFVKKGYVIYKKDSYGIYTIYKGKENVPVEN